MDPDPTAAPAPTPQAPATSGGISTTSMQNAINYAKSNPNSSYAMELQTRIQSGQYNDVLKSMGKDVSQYGTSTNDAGADPAQTPAWNPIGGAVDAVKSDIGGIGATLKKNAEQQTSGQGGMARLGGEIATGADLAGKISSLPFAAIGGALPSQVKQPIGSAVQAVGDGLANDPTSLKVLNAINSLIDAHPHVAQLIGGVGTTALNMAGGIEGGEGANVARDVATGAADTTKNAISGLKDAAKPTIGPAGQGAAGLLDSTRSAVSKGNVSENLGSSVDRLAQLPKAAAEEAPQGIGMKPLPNDPLAAYDKYFDQEQKFKGDAKQDTALGLVGSEVGNAYNKVIGMRRNAGALMGSEMEKVGATPLDISHTFEPLEQELQKNGLEYDDTKNELNASRTSKVSDQDKGLLQDYIQKVNTLGANPTAAELDAFLSKTPQDIDVYKNQNNITKATNGERIIKGHLSTLGDELSGTKNPAFAPYAAAKGDYASLSKFLDEGSSFLGKKTASGDYAKDASLAKSSIQSALNGGKKDWLMQLEKLTGFPAVDHSMLALQAMKDAGNFRGSSLLDLLSPQSKESLPLSKSGIVGKVIDKGVAMGKEKLVGTPNEQTRRIIQDRMSNLPSEGEAETAPAAAPAARTPASPRGFVKLGGGVDADTASAVDAQHDAVHDGIQSLDSKDFMKGGSLRIPLYAEYERLKGVFDKGKADMEDVRQGTELLKLLGHDVGK